MSRMLLKSVKVVLAAVVFSSSSISADTHAKPMSDAQFREALNAARDGDWDKVSPKSQQHVLAPYIEYQRIKQALPDVAPQVIREFASDFSDSPLSRWLVRYATKQYGAARKWNAVLELNDHAPTDIPGKCIYYRAQLVRDQQLAFEGGRKLWLSGRSRPEQCDDLFKAMISRGEISETMIWQRSVLALGAGNESLSNYLLNQLPDSWGAATTEFRNARISSEALLTPNRPSLDGVDRADMAYAILAYQVRREADEVADLYPAIAKSGVLKPSQLARLGDMLATRSYKFEAEDRPEVVDDLLISSGDGKKIGPVLREAIAASNWTAVLEWIAHVNSSERQSGYYQYWRARALEALGKSEVAQTLYTQAAMSRDFYGFLAAERLALPYSFNQTAPTVTESELTAAKEVKAIARIDALWTIGEEGLAADEWNFLMLREPSKTHVYSELALQNAWPALSVQATISGGHWNFIEHRFPLAYRAEFSRWADEYDLDTSLLMSIARRESAFNPHAQSPVGARGLMQIMPATAKQVAREKNLALDDVEEDLMDYRTNIPLGSYYVRSLLERYQGNLIAALAGYNAGPSKVDRWLKDAPVAFDQFIESIPYRETREYVKAVLAYRVIFSSLKGQTVPAVLAPDERVFSLQLSQAEQTMTLPN